MGRVLSKEVNGVRYPLLKTIPPPGAEKPLSLYFDSLKRKVPPTTAMTYREFADVYSGRKHRTYLGAAQSLLHDELEQMDAEIKLFLKFEKDIRSEKPGRIPRCILPPSPRYIVAVGSCVRPAEHALYEAVNATFGYTVVAKGLNYAEVGQVFKEHWSQFIKPVSIDCDVSKMDQSFFRSLMKLFLDLVADVSEEKERLRQWLHWTLDTQVCGRADDGIFRYQQTGTLSSGMPFTSLAGVLVITGIVYLYLLKIGVKARLVDAGDDFTLIFEDRDKARVCGSIADYFKQFGLTLEVGGINTTLEGIEFCQCHPVLVGGKYQMVRNAKSAAMKDSCSLKRLRTPRQASAWLKACGLAGLASQGGAPIATSRYKMFVRSAESMISNEKLSNRQRRRYEKAVVESVEYGGSFEWFGMRMKNDTVVTDLSRASFNIAFDIPPHVQRAIEDTYDNTTLTFDDVKCLETEYVVPWDAV